MFVLVKQFPQLNCRSHLLRNVVLFSQRWKVSLSLLSFLKQTLSCSSERCTLFHYESCRKANSHNIPPHPSPLRGCIWHCSGKGSFIWLTRELPRYSPAVFQRRTGWEKRNTMIKMNDKDVLKDNIDMLDLGCMWNFFVQNRIYILITS